MSTDGGSNGTEPCTTHGTRTRKRPRGASLKCEGRHFQRTTPPYTHDNMYVYGPQRTAVTAIATVGSVSPAATRTRTRTRTRGEYE